MINLLKLLCFILFFYVPLISYGKTHSQFSHRGSKTHLISKNQKTTKISNQSRVLNVYTKTIPPFVMPDKNEGFSIDLLDAIAKDLGYTYKLTRVSSVAMLVDAVSQKKADLAIAAITINSSREALVDFSHPIFSSGLQIMVPIDSGNAGVNWSTYLILIKVIFVLVIALFISGNLIWLIERKTNKDFDKRYFPGVWDGFWWSAVTLTTVGYGDKTPKQFIGKFIGLIWMFGSLFLVAYFTSTITSALTVENLRGSITGFSDLKGVVVGTLQKTAPEEYLNSVGMTPVTYKILPELFESLVNKNIGAVVFDAPILQYYANTALKNRVKLVGAPFKKESYGIAFQRKSPVLDEFNIAILKLYETGTYQKIYSKWFGDEAR